MIEEIKSLFDPNFFVDFIDNKSCVVHLEGVPPNRIILDLESFLSSLKSTQKRCDYVLFFELDKKVICVLIELKSGRFSLSHVIEQLQSTANFLKSNLEFHMVYCPLLIHRSRLKTADRLRFSKQRIIFYTSVSVVRSTCGMDKNVYLPIKMRLEEYNIHI